MPAQLPFAERKTPWRGVLDLVTGCYPSFLFGGGLGRWLPVFHFHEARPAALEPYLVYLAENGYRTVTSEAVARHARNGEHPSPHSVVLCFDDAWASLWTVAAPLLRKYGFQAITYVHPGRVMDADSLRPTIDSHGGASPDVDQSATPFATWAELRALHGSGTIDIQAHTRWHAMVPCASEVTGFVTPDMPLRHPHLYPRLLTGSGERFLTPADWGAPLYPERSRYSDALRYDDPAGFEACTRYVRDNGGAAFFARPDWAAELHGVLNAAGRGRQETPGERDAAILKDLTEAREELNRQLKTDTVRHMCFPWAVAGKVAVAAAARAGYVTAFGDRLFGGRGVRPGDPPYQLMRLKHQYIPCLPGKGRRTVLGLRTRRSASLQSSSPQWRGDLCVARSTKFVDAAALPVTPAPRLCLLTGSFHPVVGGGETHARLLCAELRRRGVSVCVVTRRRVSTSPVNEKVDGVPVHRVAPSGVPRLGKYLMMVPAFLHLVRTRRDYDVIYVCGLRILGIVGALAAVLLGKRCVLRSESRGELSGGFIWERTDGRTRPVLKALFRWPIALRNAVLRKADAFLSISSVIRDEYLACGVPAARIAAIPNGIDTVRFAPVGAAERQPLRRRLQLPEGRLFAYTGKLNRGKGLEFLLRVWNDWVKTHPECKLVLLGSGAMQFLSCEAELRDYVRQHGLESSVLFAGNVTNVPEYLQAADGFLFPSESEALPLALLEALSTGLPAIASDIAAHRDIVTQGQDGWLAACNDAAAWTRCLDEYVAQPEHASEMGARGRQTVMARFSMPQVAAEHWALFRAVCAGGKGAAP